MKYQSSKTRSIFELDFEDRKYRLICPECGNSRKKTKAKDCEYYPDTNTAYCFHCEAAFFQYKPYNENRTYIKPEWNNKTDLTDKSVKYFEGRGIKQSTLKAMSVYSSNEFMPQFSKEIEVICFPFFRGEDLVNIKYRGAKKSFKLFSGAELVFYNYNDLLDAKEIVICEGEMDLLIFKQIGCKVISVPNGANNNLEYIDSSISLFDKIDSVIIATDVDAKGIELRDELIRRIGAEKCHTINLKECKDANEYHIKYGGLDLVEAVKNKKEVPIRGIVSVKSLHDELYDYFENGLKEGLRVDFGEIDKYITWETKRLAIVTGVPGSGKSEFVDYLTVKLNLLYGWKVGYFTPENYPLKYHYKKLFEKIIGKSFDKKHCEDIEFYQAYDYINENFFYILNEDDFTYEGIIQSAKGLVKNKGIKILVVDPYNKIDHQYSKGQNETQYISKFLDKLIMFAKLNDVLIFLIAHPRKMGKDSNGAIEVPTLYDISGSANFYNKTDYGFTVHRLMNNEGIMTNDVQVHWQKIKFKNLGTQGVSQLRYNYINGRFENIENHLDGWDNSNWLSKSESQKIQLPLSSEFEGLPNEDDVPF